MLTLHLCMAGNKGTAGLLPAPAQAQESTAVAAAPVLPGPCAANAPLSDGSLGFQRGSAAMLAARAERKQQALLRTQTKQAMPTGECVVHAWLWHVCMQHVWPLLGLSNSSMWLAFSRRAYCAS